LKGSILVVTDDLLFWSRIEAAARRVGSLVVRIAELSALDEALRAGRPRRILADLGARSVDVFECARRSKASPEPPELVAFGHHVDREAIRHALEAGYDRFVPNSRLGSELEALLG